MAARWGSRNGWSSTPSEFFRYRVVKRWADILLVVVSMPVTLLVIGVVSALVKLSSPGPVFYSHRRIRKGGTFFSMWKFRTMCVNSAEVLEKHLAKHPEARTEWNETHKLRYDPRITLIGSFLRRYSLDELPQLWNVLTGADESGWARGRLWRRKWKNIVTILTATAG